MRIKNIILFIIIIIIATILLSDVLNNEGINIESKYQETDTITVNLAEKNQHLRHIASGFLHVPTETIPAQDKFETLHPRFLRISPDLFAKGAERINNINAISEIVISDGWGYDKNNLPINNRESWNQYVLNLLDNTSSYAVKPKYDIWNEPDVAIFWNAPWNDFLDHWKHTVTLIRNHNPNAKIVGPSISKFNFQTLSEFIRFSNENGVLPDAISWHEIDTENMPDIAQHIKQIKEYLADNAIDIKEVEINEYGSEELMLEPFAAIQSFASLEQSGASHAARSCWNDTKGISGCNPNMFDNLLSLNGGSRSVWWVYKFYSEMRGNIVLSTSKYSSVLASFDKDTVYLLFSPTIDIEQITITISGMESHLSNNATVHTRTVRSGKKEEEKMATSETTSELAQNDNLLLYFKNTKKNDVYFIIIK